MPARTPLPFELPKLPYAYDALEPHIDARTMEIHHDKHHQAYIDNAKKLLAAQPDAPKDAYAVLANLAAFPEAIRSGLRNNVGGHVNHTFFWTLLAPGAGGPPQGELAEAIGRDCGGFDKLKEDFDKAALGRFGSGWAWLSVKAGKLAVHSTANQDSPLLDGYAPVLGLDVWEHAYYLKYQNRRAEYVTAFWNVVNWTQASANYAAAKA